MDYVRELALYKKLEGSGLAPEMTAQWDGNIEHEYIEGIPFDQVLETAKDDSQRFKFCSAKFFEWYKAYRDITNISIGDIDFTDFIVKDDRLICIDFEQCRPGFAEDDIARLAAIIALLPGGYTPVSLHNAMIFVDEAARAIKPDFERLYDSMKRALEECCSANSLQAMPQADEYLATAVCCDYNDISYVNKTDAMIEALSNNTKLWTMFRNSQKNVPVKFLRYMLGSEKKDCQAIYLTEHQSLILLPLLVKTADMLAILKLSQSSGLNLRDVLVLKTKSRGIPAESMLGYEEGIL